MRTLAVPSTSRENPMQAMHRNLSTVTEVPIYRPPPSTSDSDSLSEFSVENETIKPRPRGSGPRKKVSYQVQAEVNKVVEVDEPDDTGQPAVDEAVRVENKNKFEKFENLELATDTGQVKTISMLDVAREDIIEEYEQDEELMEIDLEKGLALLYDDDEDEGDDDGEIADEAQQQTEKVLYKTTQC